MSPVSRRAFGFGLVAAVASGTHALGADYPETLAFAAYRKGRQIGEHRLSFESAGDVLTVRTRAEMSVKLGPVTVYRYLHEAVERWRGGRFDGLETRTVSGGKRESVEATRSAAGVMIRAASQPPVVAPASTVPFTHWNLEIARAPLFNPQTGKLVRAVARMVGESPVLLADGRTIEARRITFTGDAQIDDWYDAGQIWAGLRGRLDDGSILEYRRL